MVFPPVRCLNRLILHPYRLRPWRHSLLHSRLRRSVRRRFLSVHRQFCQRARLLGEIQPRGRRRRLHRIIKGLSDCHHDRWRAPAALAFVVCGVGNALRAFPTPHTTLFARPSRASSRRERVKSLSISQGLRAWLIPITTACSRLRRSPDRVWCVENALRAFSTHHTRLFTRRSRASTR